MWFLGVFLFRLGLKQKPPASYVVGIAAEGGPEGEVALNYFLDLSKRGDSDYSYYNLPTVAFIPAMYEGKKKLLLPQEVCSQPDWHLLGFPILDPTFTRKTDLIVATKIKGYPSTDELLELLRTTPPATYEQAHEWFGILSQRISGLCS